MGNLRDKYTDEEWDQLQEKAKMNSALKQRVAVVSDEEGTKYVIPYEFRNNFKKSAEFDKYKCSTDPFSEFEFYIKKRR